MLLPDDSSANTSRRDRLRRLRFLWILLIVILFGAAIAFAASDTVRFVVCSTAVASIYGVTGSKDVDEAAALEQAVTSKTTSIHRFVRNSISRPDRPPIFVNPGSRAILTQPPLITVYEIKDQAEQDTVIGGVEAVMRDQKLKRVDLCFMDHENWIVRGNVGERGPELQLRRVRITQKSSREEGGLKTITYPVL